MVELSSPKKTSGRRRLIRLARQNIIYLYVIYNKRAGTLAEAPRSCVRD